MGIMMHGLYRPQTLGMLPKLRKPKLGVTMSFPSAINIVQEQGGGSVNNTNLTGFVPQGVKEGILIGLGGAGVTYASRLLPGMGEPVAMIGGLCLLGLGLYKVYDSVSGNATPNVESFTAPPDQAAADVAAISGEILEPLNNGTATLSNMWTAVFETQRTFKIKFIVKNSGKKPVTTLVDFRTEQISRPLVGAPQVYNFSTTYVLNIAPDETKVVPGFQPVQALSSMLDVQSYRSQDITATLWARMGPSDQGKKLNEIKFTAW